MADCKVGRKGDAHGYIDITKLLELYVISVFRAVSPHQLCHQPQVVLTDYYFHV